MLHCTSHHEQPQHQACSSRATERHLFPNPDAFMAVSVSEGLEMHFREKRGPHLFCGIAVLMSCLPWSSMVYISQELWNGSIKQFRYLICASRAVIPVISGAVPHLNVDSQLFFSEIHRLSPITTPQGKTRRKKKKHPSASHTNGNMCLPPSQTESIRASVCAF